LFSQKKEDDMSMRESEMPAVPEETGRVARAAFPKGNPYILLRDELGSFFQDGQFSELFGARGRSAKSPAFLALVCALQFAENLSDRQAADAVRARLDWKYFLGLELDDPGFHYSILSEFRNRLIRGEKEFQLLDGLLAAFRNRGVLKAGGRQRTDSTHVIASVRDLNRLEVAGETLRAALNGLSEAAPEWTRSFVSPERLERYGRRFDRYRWPKSEAGREELARTIGEDGALLLDAVFRPDAPPEAKLHPAVEVLRRVWIQQYFDQDGRVEWRNDKDLPPAERLIQSPHDPEARFCRKRGTAWTGYKVHVTETCDGPLHVVTHVETTPATRPDVRATPVVHEALERKGLLPAVHLVDSGYVDGRLAVESRRDFGVDLVGRVAVDGSWQAREGAGFDLASFRVDWEEKTAVCPRGAASDGWSESRDASSIPVIHVRFPGKTCRACPDRSQCTRSKNGPRTLKLRGREEHEALRRIRETQKGEDFKKIYSQRAGVEGTISQHVRKCGGRKARYVGEAKTRLQNVLIAVGLNLARFGDYLSGIPHAKTRTSPFQALAAGI
jgi:transposase